MLEKSEISLRSLEKEDVDFLLNLENDTSIWEVSRTVAPFTKEEIADYVAKKVKPGGVTGSIFNVVMIVVGGGVLSLP